MKKLIIILFFASTSLALPFHATRAASIILPEGIPIWEDDHIVIDEPLITRFAGEYCSEHGADTDVLEFIGGYLPLSSVDEFCQTSPDKTQMSKYLGNMYLSGFYGGVWLRDVLFLSTDDEPKDIIDMLIKPMENMSMVMGQIMVWDTDKDIFKGISLLAGGLVDLSLGGLPFDVRTTNRLSINTFMMIYGYNWGYYDYLINNPPEGVPLTDNPLSCNTFMDCSMESIELETLRQYKPVLNDLLYPKRRWYLTRIGRRWFEMRVLRAVHRYFTVGLGNDAWEDIAEKHKIDVNTYEPLVELSARFMLVSELTHLPTMKGYAEKDITAGRCGLLQEAGMMVWLGGYIMGVSSNLPEGTFPSLDCDTP